MKNTILDVTKEVVFTSELTLPSHQQLDIHSLQRRLANRLVQLEGAYKGNRVHLHYQLRADQKLEQVLSVF